MQCRELQHLRFREETMTKPVGVGGGPANHSGMFLAVEARALALAGFLAALAGIVDALGYLHLGGLFISFMSGNSTQLSAALGQGDLAEAGMIAKLIVFFVLGAAAGQVLAGSGFAGAWHLTWVLIAVTFLLALAAVLAMGPEPMVVAMGALNASLRRAGNIPISLTFVTGVLVRFGQGLGDFLTGRVTGFNWLLQATPWVGLIAGATLGTLAYGWVGEAAIWFPVILAGALACCSVAIPEPE
jgi:uncharacterized membrane protein YoaK (UPF0700 family)